MQRRDLIKPLSLSPLRVALAITATLAALQWVSLAPAHAASGGKAAVTKAGLAPAPEAPAPTGVINLNTATAKQLTWLPGVGPSRAERIVAYRERHPFAKVLHLARVKGIGLKTVNKLKPWLAVKGQTTLTGPLKRQSKRRKAQGST
jgi:competence protein ComEA